MAKTTIQYGVNEGTVNDKHYFAAKVKYAGKLSFDALCEEACDGNVIKPSEMKNAVSLFLDALKRNVKKGFRCELGEQFLSVYPKISCTSVDDPDKKYVAKKEDIKASRKDCKKTIGATVNVLFSQDFAQNVNWQKVNADGTAVDDGEEDITDGSDSSTSGGGTSSGGGIEA